jgi:hypothetical protein
LKTSPCFLLFSFGVAKPSGSTAHFDELDSTRRSCVTHHHHVATGCKGFSVFGPRNEWDAMLATVSYERERVHEDRARSLMASKQVPSCWKWLEEPSRPHPTKQPRRTPRSNDHGRHSRDVGGHSPDIPNDNTEVHALVRDRSAIVKIRDELQDCCALSSM